jgi:hypothetical protein
MEQQHPLNPQSVLINAQMKNAKEGEKPILQED